MWQPSLSPTLSSDVPDNCYHTKEFNILYTVTYNTYSNGFMLAIKGGNQICYVHNKLSSKQVHSFSFTDVNV